MNIRFDSDGRLLGGQDPFPPPKIWSFNFGYVYKYVDNYTDVIDLGENSSYTFLVARKIGNYSTSEILEIQSSIDNVRWALAPGGPDDALVARYQRSNYSPSNFCIWGRPIGRYVRVRHKNGNDIQNELIIDLIAYGGI